MLILYWADYTPTLGFNTGVQRVTRMLGRALLERGAHVLPVVWSTNLNAPIVASNEDRKALRSWSGPDFGEIQSNEEAERQLAPLYFPAPTWLLVPEVTHLTRHQQDLTRRLIRYAHAHRIKTAFLFYDALLSKWGIYEALRRPHELYMLELANADVVLPISRHVAQEIRSWWAARATRTVNAEVVACPLPAEFPGVARVTSPATRAEEDIHIVSVGSLDRRKNQQALISALERLPEAVNGKKLRVTLVGLGESPSLPTTARRNVRIEALGAVAEERLVSLYKECSFTVVPSLDEGFGLPIAESLWFGKPCICAGFGAMGELARGGGCFTVDPRSLEQLSTAIARFVMEPKLRHKLTEEACSRPLDTWSDYAGSVLNCLQPRP